VIGVTLARPDSDHHTRRRIERRPIEVSTRPLTDSLTQVSIPGSVLGYVRTQWNGYAALRGTHLASAQEVGCYPTRGLALEALRQRPRTI
jgi:hypothetical protein